MEQNCKVFAALASLTLAACSSIPGDDSNKSYIIPNSTVNVSQSMSIPAESVVAGALVFLVVDPLAPNWRIEEARLNGKQIRIALTKKRFTNGGDGEAAQIFHRRAAELVHESGAARYEV